MDRQTDYGDSEDRRKRRPPADFERTQYGNPVHLTFGSARNASDVLMQGAREAARNAKTKNSGPGPFCRVCESQPVQGMTETCKRCRRMSCHNCCRHCERCLATFCSFCSTNNYKERQTRV